MNRRPAIHAVSTTLLIATLGVAALTPALAHPQDQEASQDNRRELREQRRAAREETRNEVRREAPAPARNNDNEARREPPAISRRDSNAEMPRNNFPRSSDNERRENWGCLLYTSRCV